MSDPTEDEKPPEGDFDVVVTVRLKIPKADTMYVRNGQLRTELVKSHAVYVLDRVDPDPTVDVEVMDDPGETR